MPKVLTHKEYEALSLTSYKSEELEAIKPTGNNPVLPILSSDLNKPEEIKKRIQYIFLHPDNGTTSKINGRFIIEREGKRIEVDIIDGIIKTEDEYIKNELILKGMIFTNQKTLED